MERLGVEHVADHRRSSRCLARRLLNQREEPRQRIAEQAVGPPVHFNPAADKLGKVVSRVELVGALVTVGYAAICQGERGGVACDRFRDWLGLIGRAIVLDLGRFGASAKPQDNGR